MNFQKSNIHYYFKVFVISLILLGNCSFLFAQKEFSDSTSIYEYWCKRGIIEILYAYMDDYISTVTDSLLPEEKKKACSNEIQGLKTYERQFISKLNEVTFDGLSSKFDNLSSFLVTNNWPGAEKNILQPLIRNFRTKTNLNSDFFTTFKPTGNKISTVIPGYSNKMINWDRTVKRIISDYNRELKKLNQKDKKEDTTSKTSNQTKPPISAEGSNPPVTKIQNWKYVLLIGLLSFLIGMITISLIIKSRIYYLLEDEKRIHKKSFQHGLLKFLFTASLLKLIMGFFEEKVAEPSRTIETLEKNTKPENETPSKTSIDNVEIENSKVNNDDSSKSIEWDISKERSNNSISFFTIPEKDGRFIIKKGEQTNDGSKYYQIVSFANTDEADLVYICGNQDKRAINRLDSYLKPVCDIDNITNAESAFKIAVLKNGKVIKIDDSWVIDPNHKVKIKLV